MTRTRARSCTLAILGLLVALGVASPALAGGSPERTLLVVNARSPISLEVANLYRTARGIPDNHVVYLYQVPGAFVAGHTAVTLYEFRTVILQPVLDHMREYGMEAEIDQIVYSTGFPYCVDITEVVQAHGLPMMITPTASLTGLTWFAHQAMGSGKEHLAELNTNKYFRGGIQSDGKALSAMNEWETALLEKGRFLHQQQRYSEAVEVFRKLTGSYRGDGQVWYNLACCEALINQPLNAIESLTKAVAAGWSNAFHASVDEDLISLRHREDFQKLMQTMRERAPRLLEPHGFRSSYLWTGEDDPEESTIWEARDQVNGGYYLSTILGHVGLRGNRGSEVLRGLEVSCAVDGTHPGGTVYLMQNPDVRARSRELLFPDVYEKLQKLGRTALALSTETEGQDGLIPIGRKDVLGAVIGTTDYDWEASGSEVIPGAICEHFSSFGGAFWNEKETKLSELVRAGVAGTSGSVAEPYALPEKFPTALLHVYYAHGCSLAESFYQSISQPYELLVVGDALARPFAHFAELGITAPEEGAAVKGEVMVEARVLPAEGRSIGQLELWVDGLLVDEGPVGRRLKWDTARTEDGAHELRVVAEENTRIGTRTSVTRWVSVDQHGHQVTAHGPAEVGLGDSVKIVAQTPGASQMELLRGAQVLAALEGGDGDEWRCAVPSEWLGRGESRLQVRAVYDDGRAARSSPFSVRVGDPPRLPPLTDAQYSLPGAVGKVSSSEGEQAFGLTRLDPWVSVALEELRAAHAGPAGDGGGARVSVELEGEFEVQQPGFFEMHLHTYPPLKAYVGKQRIVEAATEYPYSEFAGLHLDRGWYPLRLQWESEVPGFSFQAFLAGEDVGHFLGDGNLRYAPEGLKEIEAAPTFKLHGTFPRAELKDGDRGGDAQLVPGGEVEISFRRSQKGVAGVVLFAAALGEGQRWPREWVVERSSGSTGWQRLSQIKTLEGWDPTRGSLEGQSPAWILITFAPTSARKLRVHPAELAEGDTVRLVEIEVLARSPGRR